MLQFRPLTETYPAVPLSMKQEHVQGLKRLLMKRLTWLVLVAYTLLMLKPVMPVVMDTLAHTFWEQQHLLMVHEVNGEFHVHNELVNATHQSEKDKQAYGAKVQVTECVTEQKIAIAPLTTEYLTVQDTHLGYTCYYPSSSADIDVPPPRA